MVEVKANQGAAASPPAPRDRRIVSSLRRFFQTSPILRFVLILGLTMGLFYALLPLLYRTGIAPAYLRLNAATAAAGLNLLGENAAAASTHVISPRASLEIHNGCDALEPTALFIAGVLGLRAAAFTKLIGIVCGVGVLFTTNFLRIVSLYFVRIHWPERFEMMHLDVWQPAFVVLAVSLWTLWALWAIGRFRLVPTGHPS